MDKPIEIIVVLFVALVVGASILAFAAQVLDRAQQSSIDLATIQSPLDSRIFSAPTLGSAQANALALSCHDQHYRQATTEDTLCAVFRTQTPVNPNDVFTTGAVEGERAFTVEVDDAECRAVFITYRPFDAQVTVEC